MEEQESGGSGKTGPEKNKFVVFKDDIVVCCFRSFYKAYMYALNRFCSEDFFTRQR